MREMNEKVKTRNDSTNRIMAGMEAKLFDIEKSKVDIRKERDKLNARVAELEQESQAQMMR